MNKIYLIGNLTRDPETGETNNGTIYCRFSIAVQRRFKDANGENKTDFFNVTAWRGLAENVAKYTKKGKKVAVVGSVQMNESTDRDGNKRIFTEVIAEEVEFLSPKSETETIQPKQKPTLQAFEDDADIPF